MEVLSRCPFCSGEPIVKHESNLPAFYVACDWCEAEGPLKIERSEAVAAWNTRSSYNWRTMESAPKDGTVFLAYEPPWMMVVCKWNDNFGDGYWSNIVGDDDHCDPTHWMPLPKPPAKGE